MHISRLLCAVGILSIMADCGGWIPAVVAPASAEERKCTVNAKTISAISDCLDRYENAVLPARTANRSDEMRAERIRRCHDPIPKSERSKHARSINKCGDEVVRDFIRKVPPIKVVSEKLLTASCSTIAGEFRDADDVMGARRRESYFGRLRGGYEMCELIAQLAHHRTGSHPSWYGCKNDKSPEAILSCLPQSIDVGRFRSSLEECRNSGGRIASLKNEANGKLESAFSFPNDSRGPTFFTCKDVRYAATALFADASSELGLEHVPGEKTPNERDVHLAIAPHFGRFFPMIGNDCDISEIDGCVVSVFSARARIAIQYVRNIQCAGDPSSRLTCDFTMKLSCESNDPAGVFCGSFGMPYPYAGVLFERGQAGWRIVAQGG